MIHKTPRGNSDLVFKGKRECAKRKKPLSRRAEAGNQNGISEAVSAAAASIPGGLVCSYGSSLNGISSMERVKRSGITISFVFRKIVLKAFITSDGIHVASNSLSITLRAKSFAWPLLLNPNMMLGPPLIFFYKDINS